MLTRQKWCIEFQYNISEWPSLECFYFIHQLVGCPLDVWLIYALRMLTNMAVCFQNLDSEFLFYCNRFKYVRKWFMSRNRVPCCSQLFWLISKMNTSQQISANITQLSFLLIDDDNFLVIFGYWDPLVQFNRTILSVIQSTLVVGC